MSCRSRTGRALDSGFTRIWSAAGWLCGRALPAQKRWRSDGNERVLVIAPHPDDEVAGVGGTILLHQRAGDQVTVLHVTDGRRSRAGGLAPEAMARRRYQEARESVKALGVARWEWLGLFEGEWADCDLAAPLERLVRELAPLVIYAPSRVDFHPEHYRVARVTANVLGASAQSTAAAVVRVYQIQVPLTWILVNLVNPILDVFPELLRVCDLYASQEGSLRSALRLKRYGALGHRIPGVGEEFWEMTVAAYVALHASEPSRPLVETFRGLRRLSPSDPLAFLRGATERRRLARLATKKP